MFDEAAEIINLFFCPRTCYRHFAESPESLMVLSRLGKLDVWDKLKTSEFRNSVMLTLL